MKKLLALIFMTILTPFAAQGESLADELSEIYMSSDKGFERILELYDIPTVADILIENERQGYVQPSSGYYMETIALSGDKTRPFRIHIRHPQDSLTTKPLPVVFVAAGIYSSEQTLGLLPRRDDVIFVVYEYPVDNKDTLSIFKGFEKTLQSVPAQMAAALSWLSKQPWTNPYELHTLNISLGSVFAPLAQRVAQVQGTNIRSSVLAYGGADLSLLIDQELQGRIGHKEREIVVDIISSLTRSIDPTMHLPYLKSQILIVYGLEDKIFPKEMTQLMIDLTPDPKQVVGLPGGHINTEKWDIIKSFGETVMSWYQNLGTID